MRALIYLLIFVFALQSCSEQKSQHGIAGDKYYFIKNGKILDLQAENVDNLQMTDEYIRLTQRFNLFAGKTIGSGDFHMSYKLKYKRTHEKGWLHFKVGNGDITIAMKEWILMQGDMFKGVQYDTVFFHDYGDAGEEFNIEFIRKDQTFTVLIDNKVVYQVDLGPDKGTQVGEFGIINWGMTVDVKEFKAFAENFGTARKRNFTIPQYDLNERTDLQVVVDKDTSEYLGHPSSVLLDDNKTMVMMYLNGHARASIRWKKSYDAGLTWTDTLPVQQGWNKIPYFPEYPDFDYTTPFKEIPILYRIKDKKGTDRIFMYTGVYPTRLAYSEDNGNTWSPLQTFNIGEKPLIETIVLFSDIIQLKDGRYMATFHSREGIAYVTFTDDGFNFSEAMIAADHEKAFMCEGAFVRSPDGDQIAMLMRENNRVINSTVIFSEDEGKAWSEPRELPNSLIGDRHKITQLPDGRLFISFRDTGFDTPTQGDWVAWIGTYDDILQGNEGQYRIRLKDNFSSWDCGYPTHHLLPDGTLFIATYGHWDAGEKPYILSFRLPAHQLDSMFLNK